MRFTKLLAFGGLLVAGLFVGVRSAQAAPPPASGYCQTFPVVCLTDNKLPDLRLQVNGFTAMGSTTVVVDPPLKADINNTVIIRARFWDANNLLTDCIARRYRNPSAITIKGVSGASPWDTDNTAVPSCDYSRNSPSQIKISNITPGIRNTVDLVVVGSYLNVQYRRTVRIPIDGYTNNITPSMTFKGSALPTIPADAPANTYKSSTISWTFVPNDAAVGLCTARIMRVGDANGWVYPPWGEDGFLKANDFFAANILFPNTPDTTWTYTAELTCANVTDSIQFNLIARRLASTQGDFTFDADPLPEMPFDAPNNSGMSTNISWELSGNPGDCSITPVTIEGAWYHPGLNVWGTTNFIKNNPGQEVTFQYPNRPGASYRYIFKMNCKNVGDKQITLVAYRGTQPTDNFTFTTDSLPIIPADAAPGSTRPAVLSWKLEGDVGACIITEVQADAAYTPGLATWGNDSFIHTFDNEKVDFTYPDTPGETYNYVFEMSCTHVPGSQRVTLQAQRRGTGAGRVLNFGSGSTRF